MVVFSVGLSVYFEVLGSVWSRMAYVVVEDYDVVRIDSCFFKKLI